MVITKFSTKASLHKEKLHCPSFPSLKSIIIQCILFFSILFSVDPYSPTFFINADCNTQGETNFRYVPASNVQRSTVSDLVDALLNITYVIANPFVYSGLFGRAFLGANNLTREAVLSTLNTVTKVVSTDTSDLCAIFTGNATITADEVIDDVTDTVDDITGGNIVQPEGVPIDATNTAADATNTAADATNAAADATNTAADATNAAADATNAVADVTDTVNNVINEATDTAGNIAGNVVDTAADATGAISDIVNDAANIAGGAANALLN